MRLKFPDVCEVLADEVARIAEGAGKRIRDIYQQEFDVEHKEDGSPLTMADHAANDFIIESLNKLGLGFPILSEESSSIPYEQRSGWETFWLVDPLDGTKEFVNRNGEFTVNIALINHGRPVIGVVHVPVSGVTYTGCENGGAFRIDPLGSAIEIRAGNFRGGPARVVGSRSHAGERLKTFIERYSAAYAQAELVSMGSSLKLCLVAEGEADVYPRFGPTSEWDTAAAHAVVSAAGGRVIDLDGNDLVYNKPDILNPFFLVVDQGDFDWSPYASNGA
ncbi:MAG: 3'(2'),5'-bisphosphate nucleotidase CysQ [Gammaproteobacteria bacterium]|nr:3'(2'),5'-bisphosphate nucleotidase CysQ [Gammaproteobacteria bacterium]